MLADGQNTNTTCKRKRYWADKLLVVNYGKFHLTIFSVFLILKRWEDMQISSGVL